MIRRKDPQLVAAALETALAKLAGMRSLLSVAKLAERWDVQQIVVLRLIADGTLPAIDIGREGSTRPTWRICPLDILEFEAKRTKKRSA